MTVPDVGVATSPPQPADTSRSAGRAVLSGSSWSLLPQVTSLLVNLALTPYILHGLGIARYGLYMFVLTLGSLGGSFDGGLTGSAQRFFSVFAGRDDRRANTELLATLLLVVTGLSLVIFGLLWFAGPVFVDHLHMDPSLRGEGIFLVRTMAVLLGLALFRNVFTALLYGYQRFALPSLTTTVLYAEYVAGLVLTVERGWGLRGIAWTFVIQQALVTLVLMPATFRHLDRQGWRPYSWPDARALLAYAGKLQVVGLSYLFLLEMDVLVVGAIMPIRFVAFYNTGANFALQLRSVVQNGVRPMITVLGQTLGRSGPAAMQQQFLSFQRAWIRFVSGWCVIGAAAAVFGITAWLGADFLSGGIVGAVALIGNLFFLAPAALNAALGLLDRPGIQARFGVVMVIADVVLTVPLLFLGPIGVAASTALAQVLASAYIAGKVRRDVSPALSGFLHEIPLVRCLVAGGVTVGLELLLLPVRPSGALGLLVCAVPAAIGLAVYAVLILGPAEALRWVRVGTGRLRRASPA